MVKFEYVGEYKELSLYDDNNIEIKKPHIGYEFYHAVSKDKVYGMNYDGKEATIELFGEESIVMEFEGIPVDMKVINGEVIVVSNYKVSKVNEEYIFDDEDCVGITINNECICADISHKAAIVMLHYYILIDDDNKLYIDRQYMETLDEEVGILQWLGGDVFRMDNSVYKVIAS